MFVGSTLKVRRRPARHPPRSDALQAAGASFPRPRSAWQLRPTAVVQNYGAVGHVGHPELNGHTADGARPAVAHHRNSILSRHVTATGAPRRHRVAVGRDATRSPAAARQAGLAQWRVGSDVEAHRLPEPQPPSGVANRLPWRCRRNQPLPNLGVSTGQPLLDNPQLHRILLRQHFILSSGPGYRAPQTAGTGPSIPLSAPIPPNRQAHTTPARCTTRVRDRRQGRSAPGLLDLRNRSIARVRAGERVASATTWDIAAAADRPAHLTLESASQDVPYSPCGRLTINA